MYVLAFTLVRSCTITAHTQCPRYWLCEQHRKSFNRARVSKASLSLFSSVLLLACRALLACELLSPISASPKLASLQRLLLYILSGIHRRRWRRRAGSLCKRTCAASSCRRSREEAVSGFFFRISVSDRALGTSPIIFFSTA